VLHEERRLAIPTVDLHLRFVAASRLGERLDVALEVKRLGSRSFTLGIEARCDDDLRFSADSAADSVLVCADQVEEGVKSRTLPDDLRAGMERFLETAGTAAG
jgi:4-hydroxybenzoyl-CoA thioesterase